MLHSRLFEEFVVYSEQLEDMNTVKDDPAGKRTTGNDQLVFDIWNI